MANAYYYSNTAQETTLSGSISAGATSITVGATTGFPSSFPYVLALDYGASAEELVSVTAAAGTTLTVSRGFSGTSAQTHSLGAKVRHVYHAGDATDFRTHEAATSGVHGVTGTLVGTSDTQTLANKTLTAPAITSPAISGGGSIAGTFTGTPTFSGAVVFSGAVNHTSTLTSTQSGATSNTFGALVSGDTFDRFRIMADGKHEWGPGSAARDVALYRDGVNVIATDGNVRSYRTSAASATFSSRLTGDVASRGLITADGSIWWGDGTNTTDVNLYRPAAGAIKTDGIFDSATTATTTGVTPTSGWTVTIQALRVTSGVSTVNVTLNRSGADLTSTDLGGSNGNITPDLAVCTVPTAWRPPDDLYIVASTGIGHGSLRVQTADGSCQLLTWIPNQGITSGSNLRFTYTFSS
ncbi:hypothetical protein ACI2L4_25210 [Streptomyces sparsogenes]|uniref:hypothetical protein n=1 Tax=Streptomyces sparsogenes TaxID=67365 RepID=UPI0038510F8A